VSRRELRLGTRGSTLALVQARLAAEALEQAGQTVRIVVIQTAGDRRVPDTAWGEGAFVVAIERALLGGAVDIAVHSAKDVPTGGDGRLVIGAYLRRADPRDALVLARGRSEQGLDDLPASARVGTDSPRRTGFLRARRPDLRIHPLHGNVDTRLRRLDDGETDALVIACAGLDRLGRGDRIAARLEPDVVPPAPGQGAIAVQALTGDERTLAAISAIDHAATRHSVQVERTFLAATGGGCRAPVGALATVDGRVVSLLAGSVEPDGSDARVERRQGPLEASGRLAVEMASELGHRGGGAMTTSTPT